MLLYDANLPPTLVSHLSEIYPNCIHVDSINLRLSDEQIWQIALKENLIIVTKDNDFTKIMERKGFPPKIIQIKRGNCKTTTLIELLKENLRAIHSFSENEDAGILFLK